jgi:hypothetical protein
MNDGGRLLLMAVIGFLLIQIGLSGKLGSVLGAMIDPNSMIDVTQAESQGIPLPGLPGTVLTPVGGA